MVPGEAPKLLRRDPPNAASGAAVVLRWIQTRQWARISTVDIGERRELNNPNGFPNQQMHCVAHALRTKETCQEMR
jgi:hypothetical protein